MWVTIRPRLDSLSPFLIYTRMQKWKKKESIHSHNTIPHMRAVWFSCEVHFCCWWGWSSASTCIKTCCMPSMFTICWWNTTIVVQNGSPWTYNSLKQPVYCLLLWKGQGKNAFAAGIVLQHSCVSNRIKQLYVFARVVRHVAACTEQRSDITLAEQGCFCISLEILLVQIYWCNLNDIMLHSKREMAITCNSRLWRSKGRWRRNELLHWVKPGNIL